VTAGWWQNPRNVLPVAVVASAAVAAISWAAEKADPAVSLSLVYGLSLGVFTASLTGAILLWVTEYLQKEAQRRAWRHENEARHFEQIYGPLYADTKQVVDALMEYGEPRLQRWGEIHESSFGPYVEETIARSLLELESALDRFQEVVKRSGTAAESRMRGFLDRHPYTAALDPGNRNAILSFVRDDPRFLFNPRKTLPVPHLVVETSTLLQRPNGRELSPRDAERFYLEMKAELMRDPVIQKRVAECEQILPVAVNVHRLIAHRMQAPYG
jgi:hypothetical protein